MFDSQEALNPEKVVKLAELNLEPRHQDEKNGTTERPLESPENLHGNDKALILDHDVGAFGSHCCGFRGRLDGQTRMT